MKYQEALTHKGYTREQLSKGIQKKIIDFEKVKADYDEMNKEEALPEVLQEIEEKMDLLDSNLASDILKFNLENYQKRIALLQNAADKNPKKNKNLPPAPKKEKPVPAPPAPPAEPAPAASAEPAAPASVPAPVAQPAPDFTHVRNEAKSVNTAANLNYDERPQPQPQRPPQAQPQSQPQPVYEQEEFAKSDVVKPKKGSVSILLMGVGAFILTWGAVNFFKERR